MHPELCPLPPLCGRRGKDFRFRKAEMNYRVREHWSPPISGQYNTTLKQALTVAAKAVSDDITKPTQDISNIPEWCKKDACWTQIQVEISAMEARSQDAF